MMTRNEKIKKIIDDIKKIPCKDCGNYYPPECMDFDHRDKTTKKFNIGRQKNSYGLKTILLEISKCDIVCANCHRIRTYR